MSSHPNSPEVKRPLNKRQLTGLDEDLAALRTDENISRLAQTGSHQEICACRFCLDQDTCQGNGCLPTTTRSKQTI